jgi:hypothetical protein
MLLLFGLVGATEAPAGARPSRPSRPADDVPQPPDDVVPFVPELIDFGRLRDTMREKFPTTFAGLVNNGDDQITIYETKPNDAARTWVVEQFQAAAREHDMGQDVVPRVGWRTYPRTLAGLFELKDRVMAAQETLKSRGVVIESVGIQDSANQIIVGVSTPVVTAQKVLESLFGRGALRVIPWKLTEEADRFNDSPPWNGGDQLVTEGANPGGCTSGFGVHDGPTHYVTTAGHCGTHTWWNTWAGFPIRNNDTLVGATSGPVWNGTYFGFRIDTQKILTPNGSSNIIWTDPAIRRYISAPLDVAQGDPTCIEGSFSATTCGTVFATDFGDGGTQYLVDVNSAATAFGDSGAPSWRTSPFGPLAQGTHVGTLVGPDNLKVELNIFAVMFFNHVVLNTPWDP